MYKKTSKNLIPSTPNPTPDYYCTWQTQLYATCDGKVKAQRENITEHALFHPEKPWGWAYFYEKAKQDLILVMDDSWDVPPNDDQDYFGSLVLDGEKFPSYATKDASPAAALKKLTDRFRDLGWKGLGGWVCAQESPLFLGNKTQEEYWVERLRWADEANLLMWKVDWGKYGNDAAFRRSLTDLAHKHAPRLIINHACNETIAPYSDVFRTYDVPAVMSIPMKIEKLLSILRVCRTAEGYAGIVDCEDEVYMAAACGLSMGVMRHPYTGSFTNGEPDLAFPSCHRNIKTKIEEVNRAVKWHRIAPAYAANCDEFLFSDEQLTDVWRFEDYHAEIEDWWLPASLVKDSLVDDRLTKRACACVARRMKMPKVTADAQGDKPYVMAAKNPNGAISVVTLGRTRERDYWIPQCDVELETGDTTVFGVFGEYKNLMLHTTHQLADARVYMQDLSDDHAYDISDRVQKEGSTLIIPGDVIHEIGTSAQPAWDTSEPGVAIQIEW